jgi:DNA-binding transcriptional ArsR family regulator
MGVVAARVADDRFGRSRSVAAMLRRPSKHERLPASPPPLMIRDMISGPGGMAEVAALVGDTARARMLDALTDGRALTAGELAYVARVTAPTASAHLAKLVDGGLLTVLKQGRHRYYRLASPRVSAMLEGIMLVAAVDGPPRHRPPSLRDEAMTLARSCYDHLAGRLGVALADALVGRGHVLLNDDGGAVTPAGTAFLCDLGVDLEPPARRGRVFCRPCLDWTERRPHLAGTLGARLACRCFELGWIERMRDSCAVRITVPGRSGFRDAFGIDLSDRAAA